MYRFGLFSVLFLFSAHPVQARTVLFGTTTEPISVLYGEETIFRFQTSVMSITKASRFIIQPVNQETPDYSVLSVKPRFSRGSNDVNFILSDGKVVRVKLTVRKQKAPGNADSIYDFRSKATLIGSSDKGPAAPAISELQLMRSMITGQEVSGYTVRHMNQEVKTGMNGVSGRLKSLYVGSEFTGYIFILKNVTKSHTYLVRVPNLAFGNPNTALLGNIDNATLEPIEGKNIAVFRVVAKSTTAPEKLILPVTYVSKKK